MTLFQNKLIYENQQQAQFGLRLCFANPCSVSSTRVAPRDHGHGWPWSACQMVFSNTPSICCFKCQIRVPCRHSQWRGRPLRCAVLSCARLSATPWTVARQTPLSTGFSRQEHWSGLPFPPPGDLPDPRIEPCLLHFLHWQASSLPVGPPGNPTREQLL